MTYVILPGRGAMIEYDDCHLSIMIIYRAHTTLTFPPTRFTAPTCTSLLHLWGRSPEVIMVTMKKLTRRTISTDLDLRKTSHQEYSHSWYWCHFFCKLFVKQ